MAVRVELYSGADTEWDSCVRQSPGWTPFQLVGWKQVIERVFHHECCYLAARDPWGRITGVLPLVHPKSLLFGNYLISMPFVNYGGPLGDDAAVQALVERATGLGRDRRVHLLELRCRASLPLEAPVSNRKITCVLDLAPGDPGAVWDGLTSNVRRKVRRAQKEDVRVAFGVEQVDAFYQVFSRHMRDLGTPTLPRRFFAALADQFPNYLWIGCVYHAGKPVAGACGFQWGQELEVTWVSALQEYHRMYANMLLYWSFIERAANHNLHVFNFGRCTPGGGTHHFKQQWGARDVPLWWYQPIAAGRAATPSPHDRAFSWGPVLWKRLPLGLANALGPSIVRMIP